MPNDSKGGIVEKVLQASGISGLNPVQTGALEAGLLEGKSMVVAAPTASGKTLVAEFAMMNTAAGGRKTVYIVPLKALASEKYQEFKEKYGSLGIKVAISVGDLDSSDLWLAGFDVIIVTSEKLDSLIRHGAPWLESVGLVVADEIHLIDSPGRGPTLEIILTRLREMMNPQILALSATINNHSELAEWLEAEAVKSDFRPVKLYSGLYAGGRIEWHPKKPALKVGADLPPVFEIAKDTMSRGKQAMFFVSTRKRAESLAEKIGDLLVPMLTPGERKELVRLSHDISHVLEHPTRQCERLGRCLQKGAVFHHAGLVAGQRKLIEDRFRSGAIKMICATPTLAMGVNLPSYRVVVRDLKRFSSFRGMDYIPVLEVQQMMGRCVAGETKIFKDNGKPVMISEIASKYFAKNKTGKKPVKENLKILSIDIKNHQIVSSTVTHIWKRKVDKIFEIETIGGKRIAVTNEHPFLTFEKGLSGKPRTTKDDKSELYEKAQKIRKYQGYGPDRIAKLLGVPRSKRMIEHWLYDKSVPAKKSLNWKLAGSLTKGRTFEENDYIASVISFQKNEKSPKPSDFLTKKKLFANENRYVTRKGHKSCLFPPVWSSELCRFVAKIMADGNIYYSSEDNSYGIRYYNKDERIHNEYAKICLKLFGKKTSTFWRRGSYCSAFKSFVVGDFLKNIGVPSGKKSIILRVPNVIFLLRENLIRSFISEYFNCDGYETHRTYVIVTCSEKLAYDFSLLLSKIGMVARIQKKGPNKFRNRNAWEISITKTQFNQGKKLCSVGCLHPDMLKNIRITKKTEYVYDLTLKERHNFIANGLVVHNSGRPKYDTEGEAILIAGSPGEAKKLWEKYIHGEPEKIISKLGVEPVLRMHVLSLIATGNGATKRSLMDFFSKTFYAFQYKDMGALGREIDKVLEMLEGFRFIKKGGPEEAGFGEFKPAASLLAMDSGEMKPTRIGRRVAELYIDPLTANHIIECLGIIKKEDKTVEVSILDVLSRCLEMKPGLSIRKSDMEKEDDSETLLDFLVQQHKNMVGEIPNEWDLEYDEFIRSAKLTWMLSQWMEEKGEDHLMEKFGVAPGELRARLEIADWLFYSMQELGLLLNMMDTLKHIRKTRLRVRYGIKEELIPLVRLRGIGRIRSRLLFDRGFRSLEELRRAPVTALTPLVGPSIAKSIKQQLSGPVSEERKEKQHSFGDFGSRDE